MKPDDDTKRHGLRLIRGGRDQKDAASDLPLIVVSPEERLPFAVDAIVLEDDTYFVLSASPEVQEPVDPPLRLWNELHETEPVSPGEAVVRGGVPPRISAVVHDLALDPTWNEEWVEMSLDASLRLAEKSGFRSLGLQPLGCVHGRLVPGRFLPLLRRVLGDANLRSVQRIWLIGDPESFDLASMGVDGDSK
jgi:hypothetical protein